MKNTLFALAIGLSLSACNYSNEFTGTFNNAPATMSASSKNINRYCVALNITAGNLTKSSYISAQAVFDVNDFLKPMSFNTKGAECGANLTEYLEGTRNTTVMNISTVMEREQINYNWCRMTTYKDYNYKEEITFDVKNNSDDVTTGSFTGVGEVADYIDRDHPVSYGPEYFCGTVTQPYPPYPHSGFGIGSGIGIGFGFHFGPRHP
jgi:hypothetical protein